MRLYKSNGKDLMVEVDGNWVREGDAELGDLKEVSLEGIAYDDEEGQLYFLTEEEELHTPDFWEDPDDTPTVVDPLAGVPMSELIFGR